MSNQNPRLSMEEPILRKAIRWVLGIGIFLVPLWFLPFTTDVLELNKQMLVVVIAGVSLVLFLVDMIKSGKISVRFSPVLWGIGSLLVAAIVAEIASVDKFGSLLGFGDNHAFTLIGWISVGVIFFLIIQVFSEKWKNLKDIIALSVSFALILGALHSLGLNIFSGPLFGRDTFNTVGSLNGLGFLAAAALPMLLTGSGFSAKWQNIAHTAIRFLGVAAGLFVIVLVNWLMLWAVVFIAMLAHVAFSSSLELEKSRMRLFAFPMAVIVVGIFLLIINFSISGIKSKFPVEVAPTHSTSYSIALSALRKRPLGYGPEQFSVAYDLMRPQESVNNSLFQARFSDGSSEITNMLIEGGLPMLLAMLALLWFFGRELVFSIRDGFGKDLSSSGLWASAVAMLAVFFFYPVGVTMLLLFLAITALSVIGSSRFKGSAERVFDLEQKGIYSFAGSMMFVIGLVLALTGGYFATTQFVANAQAAQALSSGNRDLAIGKLTDSINGYPHDSRIHRVLSQTVLTKIADDLKAGPKGSNQDEYSSRIRNLGISAIDIAKKATELDPSDSENWMNLGFVHQNLIGIFPDMEQQAIKAYEEAVSRNPANALAYLRTGNVYLTIYDLARRGANPQKDQMDEYLNKAETNFKKAVELYDNYGQAHYNLAATYDRKGEVPQAIKSFERVVASNPREPGIMFQLGLLYYRNNQKENAQAAWERAVFLFPDYSNARWYLSLRYEELNQIEKAIDQLDRIAKLNAGNQLIEERLAKLKSGKRVIPPETVLGQKPLNNEQ